MIMAPEITVIPTLTHLQNKGDEVERASGSLRAIQISDMLVGFCSTILDFRVKSLAFINFYSVSYFVMDF